MYQKETTKNDDEKNLKIELHRKHYIKLEVMQ